MKISSKQLENVLYRLRYQLLGYSNDNKDLDFEITLSQEDPGNGVMTDCLTISAAKPVSENAAAADTDITMSVELYPPSEGLDPRAAKVETFKITSKY